MASSSKTDHHGHRAHHYLGPRTGRRSGNRRRGEPFNLGVLGKCNSGKSSFIKAMFHSQYGSDCGISPKIDFIETTMECTRYHCEDSPVALWDVPGCGTQKVPSHEYPDKINIDRYDGFIVCCSSVYSEYELALHNLIAKRNKSYVFVRTNVKSALESEEGAHPMTFNRENTLATLRQKVESHLHKTGVTIFLVDNHHPGEFDFPNLKFLLFDGELSRFMRAAAKRK